MTHCVIYLPADVHINLRPANMIYMTSNDDVSKRILQITTILHCRSQWLLGLRRRSAAARLLRLWVRIPPWAWMSIVNIVCCQVEVDELITLPEEFYRLWCVVVCDLESS